MFEEREKSELSGVEEDPLRLSFVRPAELSERVRLGEDALLAIRPISRTFNGISDTSISAEKVPLLLAGEELSERVAQNFLNAIHWLLDREQDFPRSSAEVRVQIERVIDLANEGLVDPAVPRYRTWKGHPGQSVPEEIPKALDSFCREYLTRYTVDPSEVVSFAAWIEKRLNCEIHPLSDGCGRVSKILSAAALARAGVPYPRFQSRDDYFAGLLQPLPEWTEYFRARVP